MIGCPRNRERAATSEVRYFIGDLLDDPSVRVYQTRISGLLTCNTSLDPFNVIRELKKFAEENPYQFRFAIRFTPIEVCVPTELDIIVKASQELLPKISEDESYRVTVRSRHTPLKNMQVIEAVADVIPRKVNLDSPDKTLWIEIVGDITGISVLQENEDILSIMTLRDDTY